MPRCTVPFGRGRSPSISTTRTGTSCHRPNRDDEPAAYSPPTFNSDLRMGATFRSGTAQRYHYIRLVRKSLEYDRGRVDGRDADPEAPISRRRAIVLPIRAMIAASARSGEWMPRAASSNFVSTWMTPIFGAHRGAI